MMILGLDDVADSKGKTRNFDTVVGINPSKDYKDMTFGLLKNRHGARGARVGPLPVDFSCARIAPTNY